MTHIINEEGPVDEELFERIVAIVKRTNGRILAPVLIAQFVGREPQIPFALGWLCAEGRLWMRSAVREWGTTEVLIGEREALRMAHAEPEWATLGRRECLRAGEPEHYGCGVCRHGHVYAACMPCFLRRVRHE